MMTFEGEEAPRILILYEMGMSGQLHAPAGLPPGKAPPLPAG
jgi:hypothetical protein